MFLTLNAVYILIDKLYKPDGVDTYYPVKSVIMINVFNNASENSTQQHKTFTLINFLIMRLFTSYLFTT